MEDGDHSITPTFSSSDDKTNISLEQLGERAAERGRGISAGAILADGCKTGTGAWQKAVRDCLQADVTCIGTSTQVGWHESMGFCAAFYRALFRNKGRGFSPAEQAREAAERAQGAYETLTDPACPFKVMILSPSRRAQAAFS
jgi:hypothetical protein